MPPKTQKEKASLPQTTFSFSVTTVPNTNLTPSTGKSKKRTISIKANYEFDLMDPRLPVTQEVVDALRKRIIELEETLENQQPSKRAKTSKAREESLALLGPSNMSLDTSALPNVDMKKIDILVKRFWTNLQKEVKTEKYKFRGGPSKICKIDEIIEPEEFDAIFANKGLIIQPTPTNKPTSTVTIITFPSSDDVETLFGKHFKELKGNRYSNGGIFARFEKGKKIGPVELVILGLEVTYARNSKKCTLKFDIEEADPHRYEMDEFYL